MPPLRWPAFVLALLAATVAGASDRVDLRVTLVLVDACTIHSAGQEGPGAVRVHCTSRQPYRLQARMPEDDVSPADNAGARTRPGRTGGATIVF